MRLSLRRGGIILSAALMAACATSIIDNGPLPATGDDAGTNETPGDDEDAAVDPGTDSSTKKDTGTTRDAGTTTPDTGGGSEAGTCTKAPPSNVCGLSPQCGCASGQTCDVTGANGETTCLTAGTATLGRGCTRTEGCAIGLSCWGGACRPYCGTGGQACGTPGTGLCFQVTNQGQAVPNAKICLVSCALEDPNSCGGTPASGPVSGCFPIGVPGADGGLTTTTDCQETGRSTTTCNPNATPPVECAPGYACINGTSCRRWCKIGSAACTCGAVTPKVIISGQEYGVCSN
jgi:hypothetical protein